MKPSRFAKARYGFTLIEILVVIAIIGILSAILFPVFSSVRESGRMAVCSSNLKQIGVAIRLYANDNRGFYPPVVPPGNNCAWADRLTAYLKTPEVFVCPSDEVGEFRPGCPTPDPAVLPPVSYVGSYSPTHPYFIGSLNESRVRAPATLVLVVDGDGVSVTPGGTPLTSTDDLIKRRVSNRHNDGSNCLFADGHVKWLALENMLDLKLWTLDGKPNVSPTPTPAP